MKTWSAPSIPQRFPDVCPLDGNALLGTVSADATQDRLMIRRHFVREHEELVGVATRLSDSRSFEFALIGPEQSSSRWKIAAFEWPFEIVPIDPAEYKITIGHLKESHP